MLRSRTRTATTLSPLLCLLLIGTLAACGGGTGGAVGGTGASAVPHTLVFLESGMLTPWGAGLAGDVPGLVSFDLEFLNGDHHVSTITAGGMSFGAAGPDPNSFIMAFDDDDGADPVHMSAKYCDLRGLAERRLVTGVGLSGEARLPLVPRPGAGDKIVLCGFSFQTEGKNHHIRELQIQPFASSGFIHVEYRDDSPDDDTYSVQVAYAVIPLDRLESTSLRPSFEGPYRDSFVARATGHLIGRRSGRAVISAFRFFFRNGDRHLQRVALDLDSTDEITGIFRDGDVAVPDDEADISVTYFLMHP